MIPKKLKNGDTIMVVPVSRSLAIVSQQTRDIAELNFNALGLQIKISKNAEVSDALNSLSKENRVHDIHDGFRSSDVAGIFSVIGGFNSIQLLQDLDFDLIRENPKIICGYSDVTVLLNAIYAKTGLVTYYGPHYSTLGVKLGNEFTIEYLSKCLFGSDPFIIQSSENWSDDLWYLNQDNRIFHKNEGMVILQEGIAEGITIGGNINAFRLLNGTEYLPDLTDSILFLENDGLDKEHTYQEFDRRLESILLQKGAKNIRGLIIGRFKLISEMNLDRLRSIIQSKKQLKNIPIIAGVDFGHSLPMVTIPIGGRCKIIAQNNQISLEVLQH